MSQTMPIYDFNRGERVSSMDQISDPRSDMDRENSPLSIYNHDKPDIAYAERLSEELINLSGALVTVYLKEARNDDTGEEKVWQDDADPIYRSGVDFKAYIKMETLDIEFTRWGIDSPLKANVIFHRATIVNKLGKRLLAPGDVIRVPYNAARGLLSEPPRPFFFRCLNVFDSGNFQYRWLYYTAATQLLTGDESVKIRHK